jgi:group I intron endonuclease
MRRNDAGRGDVMVRGEVYLLLFPHGRVYLGISAKGAKHRWQQHIRHALNHPRLPVHRAIAKYGPENVRLRILARTDDYEALKGLEQFYIAQYMKISPSLVYNRTLGGDGALGLKHSPETIQHYRETRKGHTFVSKETYARLAESRRGVSRPSEVREKIRASLTGKKRPPEVIAKVRKSMTGKKRGPYSEEHKEKMRAFWREHPEARAKNIEATKKRVFSEEAIAKMRAAQKGRKHSQDRREQNRQTQIAYAAAHPEKVQKQRAAITGKPRTPEARAACAVAQKARRERERLAREQSNQQQSLPTGDNQ